jgi:hypothetical protein
VVQVDDGKNKHDGHLQQCSVSDATQCEEAADLGTDGIGEGGGGDDIVVEVLRGVECSHEGYDARQQQPCCLVPQAPPPPIHVAFHVAKCPIHVGLELGGAARIFDEDDVEVVAGGGEGATHEEAPRIAVPERVKKS